MSEAREQEQQTEQIEQAEGQQVEQVEQSEGKQAEQTTKRPWYMDRIDRESRRANEAHAAAQRLEQQVNALRTSMEALIAGRPKEADGNTDARTYTQAELDAEAQRRAEGLAVQQLELRAENEFNVACNTVLLAGRSAYPDFDTSRDNLMATGVLNGQRGQRAFLEALVELPNAHDVLYDLGKHPERAIKVASMRPMAMVFELGRLSEEVKKKPEKPAERQVSNAPPPVTRVSGSARAAEPDITDPKMDMAEFIRIRDEQTRAKRHH